MSCHKTIFSACLAFVTALSLLTSCEKYPVPKTQPYYDVTYSGEMILGEPVSFQSSAPANSTYQWIFGDGNISTQASPKYTYYTLKGTGTEIGDDTVTLIINNDIYHPNIKTFKLKPPVPKITGMRTWRGGRFTTYKNCCPGQTNQTLNDTLFNIAMEDENTVRTWNIRLPYLADSNYFSNERSNGVGRFNSTTLIYTKDTIFFRQRTGTDTGWGETTYFHKF
ncbi:hypothetical protein GCM10023093_30230 [Nemorincola caseinilytica]|uniref:PKD domain-containing protein n=1 Tax=Nemorincola caseinilytica TaxID=2054315 RepID=A0ABP8NRQ3_9BACT